MAFWNREERKKKKKLQQEDAQAAGGKTLRIPWQDDGAAQAGGSKPVQAAGTKIARAGGSKPVQAAGREMTQAIVPEAAQAGEKERAQAAGTKTTQTNGTETGQTAREELEPETMLSYGQRERKQYIREYREVVQECERQMGVLREEYRQVTEYLTDIQKIDRMEGEEHSALIELCKRIQRLQQERSQYKNRTLTITEQQVRRFDRYQDGLVDEIRKMYEKEMYQKAIDSDMKHLEAEKAYIRENQKEIVQRQEFLKKIARGGTVLIISLVVLLILLYFYVDSDMTYPYIGTMALAAVAAAVIFVESNKNRYEMAMTEKKWARAVGLLNRTKIKCVNNRSVLEYDREKFGVQSAAAFENLWGEYCKTKEYERRFRENTEQLSKNSRALEELLENAEVTDPEVWLSQTYAILDPREMVEIRHDLNQRRQKLREQIQYNTQQKENYEEKINLLDKGGKI